MIVLDASAVVDVLIDNPGARWIIDQIEGADISTPAHQAAEVLSAVARLVRAGELDERSALDALEEYVELQQQHIPPSIGQLRRALELRGRVRVLDGLYVALAEELDCPLVTTDRRLAGAGLGIGVLLPPVDVARGGSPSPESCDEATRQDTRPTRAPAPNS